MLGRCAWVDLKRVVASRSNRPSAIPGDYGRGLIIARACSRRVEEPAPEKWIEPALGRLVGVILFDRACRRLVLCFHGLVLV